MRDLDDADGFLTITCEVQWFFATGRMTTKECDDGNIDQVMLQSCMNEVASLW